MPLTPVPGVGLGPGGVKELGGRVLGRCMLLATFARRGRGRKKDERRRPSRVPRRCDRSRSKPLHKWSHARCAFLLFLCSPVAKSDL
jgi:hypothetical protein